MRERVVACAAFTAMVLVLSSDVRVTAADPPAGGAPAPQPPAAAPEFPVEFLHAGPHPLARAADGLLEARVPMRWRKGVDPVVLDPTYVRFGGVGDALGLAAATTVEAKLAEGGRGAHLLVRIGVDRLSPPKRHGTYALGLVARTPEAPKAEVLLERKPTVLDAPATATVVQTRGLFGTGLFGPTDPVPAAPFYLRWTDGPEPVGVSVSKSGITTVDGKPVELDLQFEFPVFTGVSQPAPVRLRGEPEFPLGDATTQVVVRSPDMDEKAVAVTTRSRGSRWEVLILAAFGVFATWFARGKLRGDVEGGLLRLRLLDVHREVRKAFDRSDDAAFHQELSRIDAELKRIDAAVRDGAKSAADLDGEVTALAAALKKALADVADLRKAIEKEIGDVRALLLREWSLPPAFAAAVATARSRVDAVDADVGAGRLRRARGDLSAAVDGLDARVRDLYRTWRAAFLGALPSFDLPAPLPKAAADALKPRIEEARAALKAAAGATQEGTKRAQALLDAVHVAGVAITDGLRDAVGLTRQEVERIEDNVSGTASQAVLDALLSSEERLAATGVETAVEEPAVGLKAIADALSAATKAIREAVAEDAARRAKAVNKGVPKVIDLLFDQGLYDDALKVEIAFSGGPPPAPTPAPKPPEIAPPGPRAAEDRPGEVGWALLELDREAIRKQVKLARAAQWFWATLLATMLALAVFGPTYVGTWPQMLSVFFWGLAADLGLNSLTEKAKSLAK